jgi:hypothetical protein
VRRRQQRARLEAVVDRRRQVAQHLDGERRLRPVLGRLAAVLVLQDRVAHVPRQLPAQADRVREVERLALFRAASSAPT